MFVIGAIEFHQPLESRGAEDDDVIETLASRGSNEPFGVRVLPRRMRCGEEFVDAHRLRRLRPYIERVIAVPDQVSRRSVPGERFAQLLSRPRCGGLVRDGDVHYAASFMGEDHEDEQQATGRGRHHEEVRGHHLPDVILQERTPGLRRRASPCISRPWPETHQFQV